ncbi:MAG: response regulator [Roseibium sp.]
MLHKMIRVLVAEENATARDVVKSGIAVLREKRYIEIDAVSNGYEALQALKMKAYDIAFIDLGLSGHNGQQVFAAIKDTKSFNCLTVAMSNSMDTDDGAVLKQTGAYHYLKKPFRHDDVTDIVATSFLMTSPCPILIVDDSATMRKITRSILENSRFEFEIAEADCAKAALRMLAGGKFKIVLTDFHMPGGDGLELAGAIRDMSSRIGVYMMSTNDTSYLERSAAFIGIAGFLKKPFTSEDIDAVMHEHLELSRPEFGKNLKMFSFESQEKRVS